MADSGMDTLLSFSKSAINSALTWSEYALLLFGAILVIGLIGEEIKNWEVRKRLFVALVIIGVAGECFADAGIFLFSHALQIKSDNEIAEANKNAGDAKSSAEGAASAAKRAKENSDKATASASNALILANSARQEADSFERDIVSAKKQAADAESHLADALRQAAEAKLELEKFKAPRIIPPERQAEMSKRLEVFAGTPYDLSFGPDSESLDLMRTIRSILSSAKWVHVSIVGVIGMNDPLEAGNPSPLIGSATISGVLVEFSASKSPDWFTAADTLVGLLRAAGIATEGHAVTGKMEANAIHITVGNKPRN